MEKENMTKNKEACKNCPPEKSFWTNDGKVLKNLKELPKTLRKMEKHTFRHHVNKEKNDFANWIGHVFGENKLADEVRNLKSRTAIIRTVRTHLK